MLPRSVDFVNENELCKKNSRDQGTYYYFGVSDFHD
jgi:hypothetical protein